MPLRKKEMWARRRGICDYCQLERPITYIKFPIGYTMRLCKFCLTGAIKKLESDEGKHTLLRF